MGCGPGDREESDMTERLHFHFSLSCIGEGNGNPLQCSCLENPRDGGAWCAAISGVAQSRTRLKRLSSSSRLLCPSHSSGKNTGVGCHALLQAIFLTQGLNLDFLHCRHSLPSEPRRMASRPFFYCRYLFVHAIFSSFLDTFLVCMQVVGS